MAVLTMLTSTFVSDESAVLRSVRGLEAMAANYVVIDQEVRRVIRVGICQDHMVAAQAILSGEVTRTLARKHMPDDLMVDEAGFVACVATGEIATV